MTHLDLFSGIGGFALAAQTVWGSDYHCVGFCEIDPFCQQVLRKNFEGVTIYGDIRGLTAERIIADSAIKGLSERDGQRIAATRPCGAESECESGIDLLTGGFPCQPFSVAGKRKGTEDDRFLWPEMLRVIREVKPRWVIGENVAGIIEMALGQVCADLEGLDYEVQCFVIPACAVNAPHRRDRVWIVANANGSRNAQSRIQHPSLFAEPDSLPSPDTERNAEGGAYGSESGERVGRWTDQDIGERNEVGGDSSDDCCERQFPDWTRDWREVAFESCVHRMDDGVSRRVVVFSNGERISESRWRQNALKAYGNAIVPQVAMEIMRAIREIDHD